MLHPSSCESTVRYEVRTASTTVLPYKYCCTEYVPYLSANLRSALRTQADDSSAWCGDCPELLFSIIDLLLCSRQLGSLLPPNNISHLAVQHRDFPVHELATNYWTIFPHTDPVLEPGRGRVLKQPYPITAKNHSATPTTSDGCMDQYLTDQPSLSQQFRA